MGDLNSLTVTRTLSQIKLTRDKNILDKILTNMHSFSSCVDIISPLGSANHNVVLCSPLPDVISPKSDYQVCSFQEL